MKTIKFLEDLTKSLGWYLSSDGHIFLDEEMTVKLAGKGNKPVVIPTPENVATLMGEGGKINKFPFNPLTEEAIGKNDSVSTSKIIKGTKARLAFLTQELGKFLLTVAADPKLEKRAGFSIMDFISKLSDAKIGSTAKNIVDESTIATWTKMCDNSVVSGNHEILKVFSKRRGKIGDKSFNRVVTIHSPLLDALENKDLKPKDSINGVKLKNKVTINALIILLKYLLKELNDDNVLIIGSNDGKRPCFIAAMQMYLVIATHFNNICKGVKKIDTVGYDAWYTDLKISLDDLNQLDEFNSELKVLPSEKDMVIAGMESAKVVKSENDSVLTRLTNQNYNANAPTTDVIGSKPKEGGPSALDLMLGKTTQHSDPVATKSMTATRLYNETDNMYQPGSISRQQNQFSPNQLVYGSQAVTPVNNFGNNAFNNNMNNNNNQGYNFSGGGTKYRF